jgi:Ca2+-binding RTX toxin-like protein
MATATAYTAFNADTFEIASGNPTIYNGTHIQIISGSQVFDYYGSGFAYNNQGDVVGGTLNTIEHSVSGAPQYEVTGLAHSASTFNDFLQADNESGLLAFIFNGNDQLTGSSGSDVINSYAGNDFISGKTGNDVGRGGSGNDTIIGGAGNDVIAGNTGIDTASYQGAASGVTVNLGVAGSQATGGAGADTLSGIERLSGSGFSDRLTGDNGANVLKGLSGADTLTGGGSRDNLSGAGGNDVLRGDSGNDTLAGGLGGDNFVFRSALNATSNVDRIVGFSQVDTIVLDNDFFTGLPVGSLTLGLFNDHIAYDSNSGSLYFDADGAGGNPAVLFAVLAGAPSIGNGDFFVVN